MKEPINFVTDFQNFRLERDEPFTNMELLKLVASGYLHRLAETDSTVLILGATGTGKEGIAHFIHSRSSRKNNKMVSVNCGGLNEETLLSELFGHKRDAFTGAYKDKKGAIELAQDSTLFLDEIGNMPIKAQIALLRFLNNGIYQRLGELGKDNKGNARIICATNQDLLQKVEKGDFREDLYYRINIHCISIPSIAPLNRERAEKAFNVRLKEISKKLGYNFKINNYTEKAFEKLLKYHYPGNYRELNGILEHALVRSGGKTIQVEHLPIFNVTSKGKGNDLLLLPPERFLIAINELIYKKLNQEHTERGKNDSQTAKAFNLNNTRFKRLLDNSRDGKAI